MNNEKDDEEEDDDDDDELSISAKKQRRNRTTFSAEQRAKWRKQEKNIVRMFDVWRQRFDHYPVTPHPINFTAASAFSSVRPGFFPWLPRLQLPPVLPFPTGFLPDTRTTFK
ncbi:hypothetical protein KUTeg_001974, partial [Tegillarca granosa]